MNKDQLLESLRETFVTELDEYVQGLSDHLLALEKNPADLSPIEALLRVAHSLKGASRAVNLQTIELACHHLEEILTAIKRGVVPAEPSLVDFMLSTLDAIADSGQRVAKKEPLDTSPLSQLLPQLEAIAASIASAQTTPTEVSERPTAGPTPALREGRGGASVRVPAQKLDALMGEWGELLITERRAEGWIGRVESVIEALNDSARAHTEAGDEIVRKMAGELEKLVAAMSVEERVRAQTRKRLDDHVVSMRLSPFAQACAGIERTVRDLARSTGKDVALVLRGEDVELDRSLIEKIRDPLMHLVRNAVDHGVEAMEERIAAGKQPVATLTVAATLRGSEVELAVSDDGRGIDLEAIAARAKQRGIAVPAEEQELARLIFAPGFSTAKQVTAVSGRGVGLDVVRDEIEAMHGRIDLSWERGRGTQFLLTIPITLTTIRAVVIVAADQVFALANTNVRRIVEVRRDQIESIEGRDILVIDRVPLVTVGLASVLGMGARPVLGNRLQAVVVAAGARQMALLVDEVLTEQEIVVKILSERVRGLKNFAGATILPNGRVALILNVADLMRRALEAGGANTRIERSLPQAGEKRVRLLVVDDSLTIRAQQKVLLESEGFDVTIAANGREAWELLQHKPVDMVISDCEMPGIDGFALTAMIRQSPRFSALPVVLVTTLESDEDKARGLSAGANAYLAKSGFDQSELFTIIDRLV